MKILTFVPGAIVTPNPITIPAEAPDMGAVISAQIVRIPSGMTIPDHLAAAIQASAPVNDHLAAAIQASTPINDHAVHGHDITLTVPGGGGVAVLAQPAGGVPLEQTGAGAPVVHTGAVDNLAAPQVHGFGAGVPTVHGFGAGVATVHGANVGTDPVVAATPTLITTRTLSLNVNTVLGDLLTLRYREVGERVLTS